jgi:hypothetical protein
VQTHSECVKEVGSGWKLALLIAAADDIVLEHKLPRCATAATPSCALSCLQASSPRLSGAPPMGWRCMGFQDAAQVQYREQLAGL